MSIAISASLAVAFQLMSREGEMKMLRKEAITVIGLGWILASLVGALPYYLILPDCSLADAVFESTSGITTTGASVFSGLEGFHRSLLFWRAISQWIGGLGIVVFFVSLLSFLGVGAKILFSGESSASSTELDSPRVRTARGAIRMSGLSGMTRITASRTRTPRSRNSRRDSRARGSTASLVTSRDRCSRPGSGCDRWSG